MWTRLLCVAVCGLALAACSSSTVVSGSGSGGAAGADAGSNGGASGAGGSGTGGSAGAVDGGKACQHDSECNPDGGAQYKCIAGACAATCTKDSDCDDGDVCTGTEICNPTTKTCQTGTPPVCDDKDDCTDNKCDPVSGCYYPLIDADGDGHAATSLGACGDDCNDNDKTTYAGAAELCDGKDNNCNGSIDENAPTWYADCDGDGFAPAGAETQQGCSKPATAPTGCASGTWTSQAPGAGTTDCWDKDANAHPMTASENIKAWQTSAMSGNPPVSIDFDYNCDGKEEQEYTYSHVSSSASCTRSCPAGLCYCAGASGWTGAVPACGSSGTYSHCGSLLNCTRLVTSSFKQPCR